MRTPRPIFFIAPVLKTGIRAQLALAALIGLSQPTRASDGCSGAVKVFFSAGEPSAARVVELDLELPSGKALRAVAARVPVAYVVDTEGRIAFVKGSLADLANTEGAPIVVVKYRALDGEVRQTPLLESGRMEFDSTTRSYKLIPTYQPAGGLSVEELDGIRLSMGSDAMIVHHLEEGVEKVRMFDCAQIMSAQMRGDNYFWDNIMTGNLLLAGTIVVREPGKLFDSSHYDQLESDFVTSNEHGLLRSILGKFLILNGVSYVNRLGINLARGLTSVQIQGWTSDHIIKDKNGQSGKQRSDAVTEFNRLWLMPSLFKGDLLDVTVLRRLPAVSYDMCLKKIPLRVLVSPKAVRLMEGAASGWVYRALREKYIGEKPTTNP